VFEKKKQNNNNEEHVLITAMLVHAARVDDKYTETEKKIIKKALINLDPNISNKIEKILKDAEKKEEDSNQIVDFTREIKKYSMEFRLKIIEILWKIVYSDGISDDFESNLIRRVCGLLYVTDKDNGIIKLKVKNNLNNK
jgi:uncharacterized tellurite resistance protein B-like protein